MEIPSFTSCSVIFQNRVSSKRKEFPLTLNIALRKAKIVYNFGLSEFNRVKSWSPLRREAKGSGRVSAPVAGFKLGI